MSEKVGVGQPGAKPSASIELIEINAICAKCGSRAKGVCSAMSADQLEMLSGATYDLLLKTGEEFFLEGEQADDIIAVKSGIVVVYRLLEDGRRSIARFMFNGDILGVGADGDAAQTLRALEKSEVCRMPRTKFFKTLSESTDASMQLVTMLTEQLKETQDQMVSLGRKTAAERLAGFFIWLSSRTAVEEGGQLVLTLPMSRTDIADYLGLTIETVSRTFAKFRREGIIELKGTQIVRILDSDALSEMAGIEPVEDCGLLGHAV